MKKGTFKMVSKRAEQDITCFHFDCKIKAGQWYWYDTYRPYVESSTAVLCQRCFDLIVDRGGIHPDDIVEA